jgi:chromosome segregation ATPase
MRSPIEQNSILDEVEGTLSATITELQELQTGYADDNANNPPIAQRRKPTEPPKSAPANQGYFMQRSQYPSTSNSLPPTPIVAVSDDDEDRLQSIQSAYDKQKRDMHTVLVENETLKKQLSLVQTRLADIDTIRIERDQFEQMMRESQINLQTVLDKLRLSRDNEEASRNNVSALEHRLEEANTHRLDALHHHHELEDEMKLMEEKHKKLREEKERVEQKRLSFEADRSVLHQEIAKLPALHQELAKLRQRPQQSVLEEAQNSLRAAEERVRHLEEQVKSGDDRSDLPSIVADLGFKMEDLQRGLSDKDRRIEELEATNKLLTKGAKSERNYANKIRGLERTVAEQHKTFRTIQAERDQLRQLIHTEFRRSANEVQKRQHPATTLLEKKVEVDTAIVEVRKKAQEFLRQQKRRDEDLNATRTVRIEELQQEIDYHVKDIVLYKLDVKGYKKDLKRAQTKLQRLEGIYSHGNGVMSQFSSKDFNATRAGVSSQNSDNSAPQVSTAEILSDGDITPPREQRRGKRLSVLAYSPDGSPAASPRKETRGFNFVGAGI